MADASDIFPEFLRFALARIAQRELASGETPVISLAPYHGRREAKYLSDSEHMARRLSYYLGRIDSPLYVEAIGQLTVYGVGNSSTTVARLHLVNSLTQGKRRFAFGATAPAVVWIDTPPPQSTSWPRAQ